MPWKQSELAAKLEAAGWCLQRRDKLEGDREYRYLYVGYAGRPKLSYRCEGGRVEDDYVEGLKQTIEAYFQRLPDERPQDWEW